MSDGLIVQLLVVFIGLVGTAILGLFTWVAKSVHCMKVDVAVIKNEFKHASPGDVLAAVGERPTRDEITEMIAHDAPWMMEREEWQEWRKKLEVRLERIASARAS